MNRSDKLFWAGGFGVLLAVVLWACFWVAVIWTVVHFIKKFW